MLIYRVEHRNGAGAAISGLSQLHAARAQVAQFVGDEPPEKEASLLRVLETEDELHDFITPDYRFGCLSLEQLRTWFYSPAGCRAMAEAGGVLATYSVPDDEVVRGKTRVAFDIGGSERLEVKPVTALHDDPK